MLWNKVIGKIAKKILKKTTKLKYKNKICIFTTSRADFGLLRHFINNISKQNKIKSFVIATGTHLEKKHGYTIREIEKENIKVHKKIKIFLEVIPPKNV